MEEPVEDLEPQARQLQPIKYTKMRTLGDKLNTAEAVTGSLY